MWHRPAMSPWGFFHFFKIQAFTSHPNCRCCSIDYTKNVVDLSAMVLLSMYTFTKYTTYQAAAVSQSIV